MCGVRAFRTPPGYTPQMPLTRQLRLRVLAALEDRVKQFRTREEIYPLRVPRDPIPLDEVIDQAVPDGAASFPAVALRSRTLLTLAWGEDVWETWVITLPSALKVYCDSDASEMRILASGGRNAGDESDRLFLGLLSESGGEDFGIEMSGGAPTRVRSSIEDRSFLVDFFLNLFEVTHTEDSVRRALPDTKGEPQTMQRELEDSAGHDFRVDVEQWLGHVMR
jgi:hypothetical protein